MSELNVEKEEVVTTPDIVFTRYLYIKKEVEISLLAAILNKKDDAALFWAFELYYSGFTEQLFYLIWRIYFEFFASLNPNLEAYMLKKHREYDNCLIVNTTNYPYPFSSKGYKLIPKGENNEILETRETIIASMIHNLLNRKYNTDVFMLRELCYNIEAEKPYAPLMECFKSRNYEMISYYIVETDDNDDDAHEGIMKIALDYFMETGSALKMRHFNTWKRTFDELVKFGMNPKVIMLVRIMHYYSLMDNMQMGKNLYVTVEPDDLLMYETVYADSVKAAYRVLPVVTSFTPSVEYLKLFKADKLRPKDIMNIYYKDWMYYASFSPVWDERIMMYEGVVNHKKKTVTFEDEGENEVFHENFGYYPDEQTKEIQEKNIPAIPNNTEFAWPQFYERHKNNGLYKPGEDELEAL